MNELRISEKADRVLYARMVDILDKAGAGVVSDEDLKQLLFPMDQMYIDFVWEGKPFTLHLEQALGISIFSDVMDMKTLNDIAQKMSASRI